MQRSSEHHPSPHMFSNEHDEEDMEEEGEEAAETEGRREGRAGFGECLPFAFWSLPWWGFAFCSWPLGVVDGCRLIQGAGFGEGRGEGALIKDA